MMQIRERDGRAYRLGRDLAQLFPRLAQIACNHLGMGGWHPEIKGWAEHCGLTQTDLQRAEIALGRFIIISTTDKARTREDAWVNSGLSAVHPAAQIMVLYFLGAATLDAYLHGVREATAAGRTAWGAEQMLEQLERSIHAQNAPTKSAQTRRRDETEEAADRTQSPNIFDN